MIDEFLNETNIMFNTQPTQKIGQLLILSISTIVLIWIHRNSYHLPIKDRPLSHISNFLVSICTFILVIEDFLIIMGVKHQFICSIYQFSLGLLLIIVVFSRLMPNLYEYLTENYPQHDPGTWRTVLIFNLLIMISIQSFMSIRWLLTIGRSIDEQLIHAKLCLSSIHPQILILLLHIIEFIVHARLFSSSSNNVAMLICQLNSSTIRLLYFTGTSMFDLFIRPNQFSATFYSTILITETILIHQIFNLNCNSRYTQNLCDISFENYDKRVPRLRMTNDKLSDDTRLLNDIDWNTNKFKRTRTQTNKQHPLTKQKQRCTWINMIGSCSVS